MDISELFTKDSNVKGTRGHTLELEKQDRPTCQMTYTQTVGSSSHTGEQDTGTQSGSRNGDASSIIAFKGRLDKLTQTRVGFFMD